MQQLIGSLGAVSVLAGVLLVVVMGVAWPIMAISITLNIRKIARQLERISNTAEATPGYVRTGPLNIR